MARKRMIDPSIWADEDFGTLTTEAMVMFIGIVSHADDEGRLPGNALYLSSSIFPYKGLTVEKAIQIRDEILSKMSSVKLYVIDNKEYIQLTNWNSYQSINRPSKSKYPPFTEDSVSPHGRLTPNRKEEKGIEKNRIENNGEFASPLDKNLGVDEKQLIRVLSSNGGGIHTQWQEKAFRYAKNLGIELKNADMKGRWLKFFKDNQGAKLESTVSYLIDYHPYLALAGDEARIKYFFATFYKRL